MSAALAASQGKREIWYMLSSSDSIYLFLFINVSSEMDTQKSLGDFGFTGLNPTFEYYTPDTEKHNSEGKTMEINNGYADKEDFLEGKAIYVTDYAEKKGNYGPEVVLTFVDGGDEKDVSLWSSALKKYAKLLGRKNVNAADFVNKYFRLKSKVIKQGADGKDVLGWEPLEYVKDFAPVEVVQ